jgi:peroxiredoxin
MQRLFFISLLAITGLVGCRKVGVKMPQFSFQTLDDKPFTTADVNASHANIFVFFHPTCEHCQNEARDLIKHRKGLSAARVYFISKATKNELLSFDSTYQITQNGFFMLADTQNKAGKWFGVSDTPTTFVYDTYKELVVKHVNMVAAETLIEEID